jgi:hypothetical protein
MKIMADHLRKFRKELIRASGVMRQVDWSAHDFCLKKAYVCAVFSKIAYLKIPKYEARDVSSVKIIPCLTYQRLIAQGAGGPDIQELLKAADFEIRDVFDHVTNGMIVVGVVTRDVIIISIRGTRPISRDWLIDFDARKQKVSVGGNEVTFHKGFFVELFGSLGTVVEEVKKRNSEKILVYVTGHSLGGALAAIMYALDGRNFYPTYPSGTTPEKIFNVGASYTFGMPRYGDKEAVKLESPFHFYNRYDIVPHWPPVRGFRCVPNQYLADVDSIASYFWPWPSGRFLRHHLIEKYIQNLARQAR